MKKRAIIVFVLFIFYLSYSNALIAVSPSSYRINFVPNLEQDFSFTFQFDEGTKFNVFVQGDLAEYITLDREEFITSGTTTATLKLPASVEKPGMHSMGISAMPVADEQGGVRLMGNVIGSIFIFVPYPGKYAEIRLNAGDVNSGEMLNFEVGVSSVGKEPIDASVLLEIYSDEKKIDSLELGSKTIKNQESDVFKKSVNSSIYRAGNYNALAIVNYETGIARADSKFRIGYLFINITNHTKEIKKSGIKPFEIEIESLWNNVVKNVYSEVNIIDNGESVISFQTPSVSLDGWEKKKLQGYFDTSNLKAKEYNINIKAIYENDFNLIQSKIRIIEKEIKLIYYVVIAGILIVAIVLAIILIKRKNGKKKK